MGNNEKMINLSDRAIEDEGTDFFGFNGGVVEKIYSLLSREALLPMSIAVLGEQGIGKSSAMHLLQKKIQSKDDDSIIIKFEPLLEGKLEIAEMIKLFYQKILLAKRGKDSQKLQGLQKIVKHCLVAVSSASLLLALIHSQYIICDAEKINCFFKLLKPLSNWLHKKTNNYSNIQEFSSFEKQAAKINEYLKDKKLKIYVFIDEIDRLPANEIITFLLFARQLELFSNLACIVAMDYSVVVNKLLLEPKLGTSGYAAVSMYLEKLFQAKEAIYINQLYLYNFAKKCINTAYGDDGNNFKDIVHSSADRDLKGEFFNIVSYLRNPRNIKKWVISMVNTQEYTPY